jgi:hypothetical protein
VAYPSLLVQRRKELHGRIGQAIEYADRLAEYYEVLADHFSHAEDWARALDYLLKAAHKAMQAFGLRRALELCEQALEAVRRLGDRVPAATLLAIHRSVGAINFSSRGMWVCPGSSEGPRRVSQVRWPGGVSAIAARRIAPRWTSLRPGSLALRSRGTPTSRSPLAAPAWAT